MKILIVDDSADDRKLLRYNLAKHGCESIIEAGDGLEGLEMARKHRPDIIISDALMPQMDGFQFLRAIKGDAELKSIPFIFHSAVYCGFKEEKLALSLGAEVFICKPKEPEEFWEALHAIIKLREAGISEPLPAAHVGDEKEYLGEYSEIVATKLEEKVRELEDALARRKQAEEALRASETRYRRLFESSKDGIMILDANTGEIIDVNPFMLDLLGYPPTEYLNREVWETVPFKNGKVCRAALDNLRTTGYIRFEDLSLETMDGRQIDVEFVGNAYAVESTQLVQCNIRDISARKEAEKALLESEQLRYRLQAEVACAADVQAKLLPAFYPELAGFEIAAKCLPAHQVGGDFYDWAEVAPGTLAFTLGDVMGNGMSAAMLMTTVRAALHAAMWQNRPAPAIQLVEQALTADLESSESFVTIFHARLDAHTRTLTYVDCGHGHAFLRRADGTVEELFPRGLPLGIMAEEKYHEGTFTFSTGDILVVYSDGLIDSKPQLFLDNRIMANLLSDVNNAQKMVDSLVALPALEGPPPDDLTVLVVYCKG